jgi:hypothetical protein
VILIEAMSFVTGVTDKKEPARARRR